MVGTLSWECCSINRYFFLCTCRIWLVPIVILRIASNERTFFVCYTYTRSFIFIRVTTDLDRCREQTGCASDKQRDSNTKQISRTIVAHKSIFSVFYSYYLCAWRDRPINGHRLILVRYVSTLCRSEMR